MMVAQVFQQLGNYESGRGLNLGEFWRRVVGKAFIAPSVAKKLQTEVEAAFLGGLLHNLGRVALDRYFSDYYGAVIEPVDTNNQTILVAELDLLGVEHEKIGGQLTSSWNYSENYAACIEHHHNPLDIRRFTRLVCVIHIGDCLCRQLDFCSGGDSVVSEISDETLDHFSMGDRGMQILKDAAKSEIDDEDSFLSALVS